MIAILLQDVKQHTVYFTLFTWIDESMYIYFIIFLQGIDVYRNFSLT